MVEEEESSTPIKDQRRETSDPLVESEKAGICQRGGQGGKVFVSGVGQPESQSEDTSRAELRPTVSQEKDDMVEMEDIRDCKVMQVEEAERVDDKLEEMVNI